MSGGSDQKVVYAAFIGNILIALTKFVASAVTGSSAMLSEGIHSTVDTGNQLLLLWGMRRAARPATADHPFGYGRELYFWSFVVAILIFGIGAGLSLYEGYAALSDPEPIESPVVNYVVLGLSLLFEGGSWTVAMREFRRSKGQLGYWQAVRCSKNPAMFTVLLEDSAAMLGLLIAFAGLVLSETTGNPAFDGYASLGIGVVLAAVAALLARESKGLLIGESARSSLVRGICRLAESDPRIERPLDVLTMHMGPDDILLNLTIDFREELSTHDIEAAIDDLERRIRAEFPEVRRIFIEPESLREHRARQQARAGEAV